MPEFIKKEFAIWTLIVGIGCVVLSSLLLSAFDGIIVALMLFCFFFALLTGASRLIFTFTFGFYLIFLTFFIVSTHILYGGPFLNGGDDSFFYDASKQVFLSNYDLNIKVDVFPLWIVNYPAYLYIFAYFFGLLSYFGLDSMSFYHLSLLKVALGSLVPVILYKVIKDHRWLTGRGVLSTVILFPTLTFYTVSLLRESILVLLFILVVWISTRRDNLLFSFLLVLIISILAYFIRPVHGILLFVFFGIYTLFSYKASILVKICALAFFSLLIYSFNIFAFAEIFHELNEVQEKYIAHSNEVNDVGSIGLKLYNSEHIWLWPVKLIYYLLSPIPPPIFSDFNGLALFLTLGSILWYFFVFGLFSSLRRRSNWNKPLYSSAVFIIFVSCIIGVSSSKDPRHLVFLSPLIVLLGHVELLHISKARLVFGGVFITLFGLLFYVFLKFI
jgi:hypothetical protein